MTVSASGKEKPRRSGVETHSLRLEASENGLDGGSSVVVGTDDIGIELGLDLQLAEPEL